jgi:hypothetical protein
MKTKLTLTIDQEILPWAKKYARSRNISLSQLVETRLSELIQPEPVSFSDKWRGRFSPANKKTERYKLLAKKYL